TNYFCFNLSIFSFCKTRMSQKYRTNIEFNPNDFTNIEDLMFNHRGRGSLCRILNKSRRRDSIVNPPNFSNRKNCSKGLYQCGDGQIFNHCLMHLEPRLQEYVKKRDYYKRNNIQ